KSTAVCGATTTTTGGVGGGVRGIRRSRIAHGKNARIGWAGGRRRAASGLVEPSVASCRVGGFSAFKKHDDAIRIDRRGHYIIRRSAAEGRLISDQGKRVRVQVVAIQPSPRPIGRQKQKIGAVRVCCYDSVVTWAVINLHVKRSKRDRCASSTKTVIGVPRGRAQKDGLCVRVIFCP